MKSAKYPEGPNLPIFPVIIHNNNSASLDR